MRKSSLALGLTIETVYLLIIALCCLAINLHQTISILLEFAVIIAIIYCLIHSNRKLAVIFSNITIYLYNFIIAVQAISTHLQNKYLSVMAIENSGKIHLLPINVIVFHLVLSLSISFYSLYIINKRSPYISSPMFIRVASGCACLGIALIAFIPNLPAPPALSFVNTLTDYIHPNQDAIGPIDSKSTKEIHYITVNPKNKYPFIKDKFYKKPIQFEQTDRYIEKPNIILFLFEGLSSRTIGCYNPKWKSLTPNINKFREISMMVKNYYSHTQATYRGIRGQLASIYPTYGGHNAIGWATSSSSIPKMELLCLPHILNQNGYHTEMWAGCSKQEGNIGRQILEHFGFKESYCSERIVNLFSPVNKQRQDIQLIPDRELFSAFIKHLDEIKGEQPFLTAVYSTQTHAWLNVTAGDRTFGDGRSETLNTIHNLDYCFGLFYDYFMKSELSKNTVVVLSSDHCHFPTKDFMNVVNEDIDYQPYFFDKTPLIIFDPTHRLPVLWDKSNFSSLDLTPSILHLLEFPNHSNHFLGNSIFEDEAYLNRPFVPFLGNEFMISDNGTIRDEKWVMSNQTEAQSLRNVLLFQRKIEVENRLWSRSFDTNIINKN